MFAPESVSKDDYVSRCSLGIIVETETEMTLRSTTDGLLALALWAIGMLGACGPAIDWPVASDSAGDTSVQTDGIEDQSIDQTEADSESDDSDSISDSAIDSTEGERRCARRVIQSYDRDSQSWVETDVCERDQRCLLGECVALPEGLGAICAGPEDCSSGELDCWRSRCTTQRPAVEGEACLGNDECNPGLLCSRRGTCQAGGIGDLCVEAEDCDRGVAPVCDNGACAPSGVGEPCIRDASCESEALYCHDDGFCRGPGEGDVCELDGPPCVVTGHYCGPDLVCHDGSTGDRCNTTVDCEDTDDVCAGSIATCRDRVEGETCESDAQCPGSLYCAQNQCQDGTDGDYCNTSADCAQVNDICKGTPLQCQDRAEGDSCDASIECPTSAPICTAVSVCREGNLGDDCQEDGDCVSNSCSNEHCSLSGFAYIPSGTFCMGSPGGGGSEACPDGSAESGRLPEEDPLHEVTLTRGFVVQETEVTQRQWLARFPDSNPSYFDECGLDCPVETVNWYEAIAYLNALSASEDLEPCYTLEGCDPAQAGTGLACTGVSISDPLASSDPYGCEGYRLPTEAEWEYANRAGTTTAFYNGGITQTGMSPLDDNLDDIGWYGGNSGVSYEPGSDCSDWYDEATVCGIHEVGLKAANAWGLYDMHGNVWEWVWDPYQSNYYSSSPAEDPLGGTGRLRVARGGSWGEEARDCRAAVRGQFFPDRRERKIGVRAVRSAP